MTYPIIRSTTFCRMAAALGIALAAITLSTTAQADRGDRGHRGKDSAVHGSRDSQATRQGNRTNRSARRDIRRNNDRTTKNRGHRTRNYGNRRRQAGFFPGNIFRSAPRYHGRPAYRSRYHRPASYRGYRGRGCRVIRRVGYDRYGRRFVTSRRVCDGRHGR